MTIPPRPHSCHQNRDGKNERLIAYLRHRWHPGRVAFLSYSLLFMRAHGGVDGGHSGCLEVGRGGRVNDGSVGCLSVYRCWIFEIKGRNKVEALLNSSLYRSRSYHYTVLDNHLYTGSFTSDFAASSTSHLVNSVSFPRLNTLGSIA